MKWLMVLAFLCVATAAWGQDRMDDFKLYKVEVQNEEQLRELKKMGKDLPIHYLEDMGNVNRSYDLVIDPHNNDKLEQRLSYFGITFKMITSNLQSLLDQRTFGGSNTPMDWTKYHNLTTIYHWLGSLVLKNPFVVTPYIVGYSYEGRPIKAIRISRRLGNKAILMEANIHAIEWISSAAGTCFINKLMTEPSLRHLTENYDWIFIPVLNPDGFEYTHNVHPLWRKNRKPTGFSNSSGICYGTDLNRNFDIHWNEAGYNIDVPCDHWYGGSKPANQPEVQALVRFINFFPKGYIRMYLALHSYGNWVLLPYGHTTNAFPDNYDQMMRISEGFVEAAKVKYGTVFEAGASGLLNYPVSGSSKDWAYGVKHIPYTATLELRDKGQYGFFLPANQIIPVCEELTDGLVGMVTAAAAEGILS